MTQAGIEASRIDEDLVRALLREQFPDWAGLAVRAVEPGGNDHRTFRLGDELSVRLPSAPGYMPQVAKEQAWLPRLAPAVPLPIPVVRAKGEACDIFPAPWSVYGWLHGEPLAAASIDDPVRLAVDLAGFLVALRGVDPAGGPRPGLHSAYRGAPVAHWDDEVRDILNRLDGAERDRAAGTWRDAVVAPDAESAAWLHGDVAVSNLLVRDGALAAVIDFGCSAVGDPACDTVIIWTHFRGAAREAFRREYDVDEATWARGRGWALWKALIMLTNKPPAQRALARHVLDELFAGV
ncbi:aminoglycoside phosphotransferase family protein [Microbacterium sp. AZCO]|uniref:aminoglycoside phosphotransferase family protein n=1 Tax=Microbacterium sp. AZCO TaxID=3142976 RepID=UPI0031F39339